MAHDAVSRSLETEPGNYGARRVRVWAFLGQHRFAQALESAQALNNEFPDDVLVYGFLTDAFTAFFGCSNGMFCDDTGANRSSSYALDISGVDPVGGQIPEPSTLLLLGTALSAIVLRRRRGFARS